MKGKLFYFGLGFFLFVCFYWIVSIRISQKVRQDIEKEYKEFSKLLPSRNSLVKNIESKVFLGMLQDKKLVFNPDTLYFIYFPTLSEDRDRPETREIQGLEKNQKSNNKPFSLIYVFRNNERAEALKWCSKNNIPLQCCYVTKDLQLSDMKIILFRNKIRYYNTSPSYWNKSEVHSFLQELYTKKI